MRGGLAHARCVPIPTLDIGHEITYDETASTHGHNSIGNLPASGCSPVCSHIPTVPEAGFCACGGEMSYNIAIEVSVLDMETHEMLGQEMYTLIGTEGLAEWRLAHELELASKAVVEQAREKLAERRAT